jgi:oligopeptide transport system substrate-binding protein
MLRRARRIRPWHTVAAFAIGLAWSTLLAAQTTLERGNGPEPDSLDPHRAQGVAAFNILRDVYEGLVTEDAQGALIPGLAQSWRSTEDGLVWTFVLRDGLRWSNGDALDAPQYIASLRRALSPATASPYAHALEAIVGAPAVIAGDAAPETLGVIARDARTLEIRLSHPAPLLQLLTLPVSYPVHLGALTAHGAQHTRPGNLIGTGAFTLTAWQPQANITLQRSPHYHGAPAALDHVRYHVTEDAAAEYQRFLAGDLHITETIPPGRIDNYRARVGEALRISPYLGVFYFGLNLRRAPFADAPQLREALVLALDRDVLTRYITALGEQPAYGLVPPGISGYTAALPEYANWTQAQRERVARARYAEAGYSADHPLRLELRYNTSAQHRRLALAVAAMWRQVLGVHTTLRNEEWRVFVQTRAQGRITEVFRGGWIADYADPASFLQPFAGHQALNTTGYKDTEFVALLRAATGTADASPRNALLAQAEARLLAAHAIVPVYHYTSKHLVDARVLGFEANPLDRHPSRFMSLAAERP